MLSIGGTGQICLCINHLYRLLKSFNVDLTLLTHSQLCSILFHLFLERSGCYSCSILSITIVDDSLDNWRFGKGLSGRMVLYEVGTLFMEVFSW